MDIYNVLVQLIGWILRVGGGAIVLFGVFKMFQGFGENGTGTDKVQGTMSALGGVAVFALSFIVGTIFPPPPSF
ncbi:hypothetical protein FACS1894104_2040 [Actinomycetota bacterium]|nr:hypothetical protein FACS1894104_2040 [Actinomycetota bacterium]